MADLIQYKCPNCGGRLEFSSGTQNMKCPYCDTEMDVAALSALDEELKSMEPEDINWSTQAGTEWQEGETDGMKVYQCQSCGGEVICDESTAATKCPYCDNPVVVKGNFAGDLRPDLVIPFKKDKKAAKDAYFKHLEGKKFLPKVFQDENHIDEIKGLYVPFWLFDADVKAKVSYSAVNEKAWSDSEYNYLQVSHYRVYRSGDLGFDNVPVDGSIVMPNELMESIEPFNMEDSVDFQTAYLSGFLADKYTVTAEDSIEEANKRIRTSTENAFYDTVTGYDAVKTENCILNLQNGKAKYALLPVWILNTTWQGEKYTFAMNGQTGKMVGNLPLDKGAFWRNAAIFGGAATAISYLVTFLLWMIS